MYRVLCDGFPIYDTRDEELVLIDPKVTLEVNKAGSFEFKLPPKHPQYDLPVRMKSCVQVFHDDVEIFNGRPTEQKIDFYKRKYIYCEGQLAFLNDSVQRPAEYHDMTVRGYLETLIAAHNEQVEESKRFTVGIVTVTDSNDSLYRYTNYNSTMTEIKEDLIDDLGGYLRVRNENGIRYLDYIKEYENTNTQTIEFGENLLDFTRNFDWTEIATVIIPLGAKLEESPIEALEQRLTIESVNNGDDFIFSADAVKVYGWIVKTVIWDNVTTPEMLLSKAKKYLSDYQFDEMVIEAKAVDLHYTDEQIEQFKLGDKIRVVSTPHGLDRYFPLTKMTVNLNSLSSNSVTLGDTVKISLTAKQNSLTAAMQQATESIPIPSAIVKQAVSQATALITAATHGHVVTTAEEQLIMDTDNVDTAKKVWRWNLNGLGYSSTGYNGEYSTAITMDGQIVGERIVANSISGEKLDITYRTQVEKEIADAEESARSDSEDYTDEKLKSYYTKSQIETTIKNTQDAILLSAKETAEQYVDGKLKNYSTTAQIKVTTDAINSEVSKKLNSADLGTKIQQNATAVKIAWNNISKYIQFESGELRIYDSAVTSTQKIVSKFNYNGSHFYRDGIYIGKIGTNVFNNYPEYRGLVFDLEYQAQYMAWSTKNAASDSAYYTKLVWYRDDTIGKKGFNFQDYVYVFSYLRINEGTGFVNYSDNGTKFWSDAYISLGDSSNACCRFTGTSFTIWNNRSVDFYSTLNLHGWGYTNDSDARMKRNIEETAVDGLGVVNGIDLKSFDWVQSGEHEAIGIIAQQLLEVAPELVETCSDGHLQLKADKLVYYCIKAIQELCGTLDLGYQVPVWSDPYTLLEKKIFCNKLNKGVEKEAEPAIQEPLVLPENNRRR